jgi:hypothetical protein
MSSYSSLKFPFSYALIWMLKFSVVDGSSLIFDWFKWPYEYPSLIRFSDWNCGCVCVFFFYFLICIHSDTLHYLKNHIISIFLPHICVFHSALHMCTHIIVVSNNELASWMLIQEHILCHVYTNTVAWIIFDDWHIKL